MADPYHWLREKTNPEVTKYLEAENAYCEVMTKDLKPFQESLNKEMLGRIKQTDLSVPTRRGAFFYYSRTEEGKQYPIYCRKAAKADALAEQASEIVLIGKAPLLLYGYGMYASFSVTALSLLDRGVAFTIAHVRSGDEMGEAWHDDGMLMKKKNTFTDFIDSQVMYWEPAKYVAKLRTLKTGPRELLLKCKMEPAGHGGASGRYDKLKDVAFEYAWLLRQLDITK